MLVSDLPTTFWQAVYPPHDVQALAITIGGELPVYSTYADRDVLELATSINDAFSDKWEWLAKSYKIDASVSGIETTTRKTETTGSDTDSGSNTNSKKVFDNSDYVDYQKDMNASTRSNTSTTTETTLHESDNLSPTDKQSLYKEIARNRLLLTVVNDVLGQLVYIEN